MKNTEPKNASNKTKLLAQFRSQNCPKSNCPEFAVHRLPDQFWKKGYNLAYKNPNVMKPVENFQSDIDLQYLCFDQNLEPKGTRLNC